MRSIIINMNTEKLLLRSSISEYTSLPSSVLTALINKIDDTYIDDNKVN